MRSTIATTSIFLAIIFLVIFSFSIANGVVTIGNNGETIDAFSGKVLSATEQSIKDAFGEARDIATPQIDQLSQTFNSFSVLPENENKEEVKKIEFDLAANCGTIVNSRGEILFDKNSQKPWPIASITKLMTALVFLDYNPGWDTVYQIKKEDNREGGKTFLYQGERVTVRDLFYSSLVGSINTATVALVNSTGMSEKEFAQKMNERAIELGLSSTNFYDVTGLSSANISTAEEVAKFARVALSNEEISNATLEEKYEFTTIEGRKKIAYNTDDLLKVLPENGIKILGGKTGYTTLAGYCFVGRFVGDNGQEITSVVLGSGSDSSRFTQTKDLAEKAYEN